MLLTCDYVQGAAARRMNVMCDSSPLRLRMCTQHACLALGVWFRVSISIAVNPPPRTHQHRIPHSTHPLTPAVFPLADVDAQPDTHMFEVNMLHEVGDPLATPPPSARRPTRLLLRHEGPWWSTSPLADHARYISSSAQCAFFYSDLAPQTAERKWKLKQGQ